MGHACAREYIFIYIGTIQGCCKAEERRWTHEKSCISKDYKEAEKEKRIAVENAFIDDAEIEPPSYLTKTQLEAFHFIVDALRQAKVLSRLDTQTIIQASVAIDMLHTANKRVAKRPTLAIDREFVATQEKLVRTYLKLCDELCLSPQSRAKLGVLVANQKEEEQDPLLNVLQGGVLSG